MIHLASKERIKLAHNASKEDFMNKLNKATCYEIIRRSKTAKNMYWYTSAFFTYYLPKKYKMKLPRDKWDLWRELTIGKRGIR